MSLLDDVSIVVTPNGYKAGELYAVVPEPTEGNELVTNGDFSNGYVGWNVSGNPSNYSIEVVDHDGKIDVLHFTTSDNNAGVNQVILQSNKLYLVKFDLKVISGNVYVGKANNRVTGSLLNPSEWTSYEQYWTANDTYFRFYSSGTAQFYLDNVSVKEYTSADMDVTRETAATRVDEDGLVNYAQVISDTELITNGDFEDGGTDWSLYGTQDTNNYVTFSNNQVILRNDGTGSGIRQVSLTSGKLYTITIDVADIIGNGFKVDIGGVKIITTTGVQTFNLTSSSNALILYRNSVSPEAVNGGTINSISVKEVTRDNVPRIDYTGGGCPHILAEPQRKNEITYSEDFSQSYWTKASPTVEGGFISPDGTENAFKLIETTAESVHAFYNPTFGVNNGDTYTMSLFIKYNGRQWFRLWGQFGSTNKEAYFDIENGLLGQKDSGVTSKIEDYGNDWYRISASATSDGTNGRFRGYLAIDDGDSFYQGDGTSGAFIWGAQFEEGSYETSYIPTSGSTVTRNQDIFTRDGIGSLINSTEGVLFVEMAALSDDGTNRSITLSDGSTNNIIQILFSSVSNTIRFIIRVGGVGGDNLDKSTSTYTVTDFNKVALKWKQNDAQVWINGTQLGSPDTNSDVPTGLNDLSFEYLTVGNNFYGKVKQLQVYTTALTDTQLAALTS